jgi:hypothetical protein
MAFCARGMLADYCCMSCFGAQNGVVILRSGPVVLISRTGGGKKTPALSWDRTTAMSCSSVPGKDGR